MEEVSDIIFGIIEDYPRADLTKGAKLFNTFQDKFSVLSEDDDYTVLVPSESSDEFYEVRFDMEDETDDCTCPPVINIFIASMCRRQLIICLPITWAFRPAT